MLSFSLICCLVCKLFIDFRKEEIKLEVDDADQVKVSGLRKLNETKYVYFDQTFKVPENGDINRTTGRLEDGILTVTVPKKETEKEEPQNETSNVVEEYAKETPQNETSNVVGENAKEKPHIDETSNQIAEKPRKGCDSYRENLEKIKGNAQKIRLAEEMIRKWIQESDMVRAAVKLLKNNKQTVITAVLAFSLGAYVSHKFESSYQ